MEYLLKASAVIALFYLCFYFFLKKETFFIHNRWFLLIGMLIALLFPLIVIPMHIAMEPIAVSETAFLISEKMPQSIPTAITEEKFEWQTLLATLYFIGLSIFLIQFLFQFSSLIVLLLKNKKKRAGRYTYVIVNSKISPFSFFKWIVFNPESFNDTELKLMLTHEKVHANQIHSIDILFTQLSCVVFWFNPMIWLYRREVKQNLEYIADFKTQETTLTKKTYQRLLLKTCVENYNISLSNNFYNSLIKERIIMLKKSRSNRQKQWRYLLILPLLAGLLMSVNTEEIYVESESPATSEKNVINSEIKIENQRLNILFNKKMTEEELDDIKKELQANNVTMTINRLKRNSKGEIKTIDISFKTENGSTNYNVKDNKGIDPFYFNMASDGSFGVGALDKTKIIIEEIKRDALSKSDKSKANVNEKIITIYEDTTNVRPIDERMAKLTELTNDSTYISLKDSSETKHTALTTKAFYLDDELPLKFTNQTIVIHEPGINERTILRLYNDLGKPLYVINRKVIHPNNISKIKPDEIESLTVLKGNSALEAYGEQGENGVIIIKLKDGNNSKLTKTTKDVKKEPWKISRTEVNNVFFIDDEDPSKNSLLAYITKYTSDKIIDNHKSNLEKFGLKVKISKLKRNKKKEITSIKITISDDKGDKSSASYKNSDGISGIEFGKSESALVVRTSTMN